MDSPPAEAMECASLALAPLRYGGAVCVMLLLDVDVMSCCYLCLAPCKMVGSNSHVVDVSLLFACLDARDFQLLLCHLQYVNQTN